MFENSIVIINALCISCEEVDTRDELLVNVLDVIVCIKERQDALRRTTTHHVFTRDAKCIDDDGGIFDGLL